MSKVEKLIEQFQKEPLPKDVDFADFKKYLEFYGFILDRTNGSHNIFVHPTGCVLTIPTVNGKSVKSYYVKNANEVIKQLEAR